MDMANMMYVWPCILYEPDGKYQLDATSNKSVQVMLL